MPNYLTICQDTARESGVYPNVDDPQSVVAQEGALLRLTHWVNDAWGEIQREQPRWRWMMAEATGDATIGVSGYTGVSLGITSRFSRWEPFVDGEECEVSAWDADIGRGDEQYLRYVDWYEFRRIYQSGSAVDDTGKPQIVSIAPNGELTVYPTPDKAYKIRAPYKKTRQDLTANTDVPEMPDEFHDAIKWKALVYLGMHDEANGQLPMWQSKYVRVMEHLRNDQLPRMRASEPMV